jgi:hypothetical protein
LADREPVDAAEERKSKIKKKSKRRSKSKRKIKSKNTGLALREFRS